MKRRIVLQATLAIAMLAALGACHKPATAAAEHRTFFFHHKKKAALPKPSPTAHLLVLPDSAISVEPGSTEDQLAAFLRSDQPAPHMFRFTGAEFAPWQSKPNPETLRTMYAVAQILRAYPHTQVTLVGHTDNDGTPAQNVTLSQQRVDRMAALLVHGGIEPRRIATIGRGLAQPIADNGTPEGRTRNRRIELIVTAK